MKSFSTETLAIIFLLLPLSLTMSKALRKKSCESVDVALLFHTSGSELRSNPVSREIFITISTESEDERPLPDVTFNLRRSNNTQPFVAGQHDLFHLEIPHDFEKIRRVVIGFDEMSVPDFFGWGSWYFHSLDIYVPSQGIYYHYTIPLPKAWNNFRIPLGPVTPKVFSEKKDAGDSFNWKHLLRASSEVESETSETTSSTALTSTSTESTTTESTTTTTTTPTTTTTTTPTTTSTTSTTTTTTTPTTTSTTTPTTTSTTTSTTTTTPTTTTTTTSTTTPSTTTPTTTTTSTTSPIISSTMANSRASTRIYDDAEDCHDLYHKYDLKSSGIYMIHPPESDSFDVLCDMTTDGGGWTVIQKRTDASLIFWNKKWDEYKAGFSNGLQRNQWLGLEKIHLLSSKNEVVTLRVELHGDRCNIDENIGCSGSPDGFWFGEWEFKVGDEASNYRLHISTAKAGNLTSHDRNDSFSTLNNDQMFTTIDRDNDNRQGENCAVKNFFGGWWHNECSAAVLNGKYQISDTPIGLFGFKWGWYHYPPHYVINPIRSEMKIRKNIKANT